MYVSKLFICRRMPLLLVRPSECVCFARCTYRRSALLCPIRHSAVRGAWSLGYMQAVAQQLCPSRYFPFGNSAAVPQLSERERERETDRTWKRIDCWRSGLLCVLQLVSIFLFLPSTPYIISSTLKTLFYLEKAKLPL
jgi:hypothetical protein